MQPEHVQAALAAAQEAAQPTQAALAAMGPAQLDSASAGEEYALSTDDAAMATLSRLALVRSSQIAPACLHR